MQIRFENEKQGYEVGCECGARFVAPFRAGQAQCPSCGAMETMPSLFDDWWRTEPTCGRFAYREA